VRLCLAKLLDSRRIRGVDARGLGAFSAPSAAGSSIAVDNDRQSVHALLRTIISLRVRNKFRSHGEIR